MEFDPSGSLLQAEYIADLISNSSGPLILTGDFNVQPTSQEFAVIASSGIRNAYADAHGGVFQKTYESGEIIDYIWYRDLQLISAEVLLLDRSDYISGKL